nr:unnamed protein product [Callosobruchus analis]
MNTLFFPKKNHCHLAYTHALKDVKIKVPEAVRHGDAVTLSCDYDLESAALYTIKWYRDDEEFYRYIPKESPPVQVFPVPHLNVDNWWPDYYKKTCSTLNEGDGSKRETFAVSNYKQFLYESSSPGYPKTWEYIDGLHSDIIKLLKEHKENPPLPNNGAYKDPVPINE